MAILFDLDTEGRHGFAPAHRSIQNDGRSIDPSRMGGRAFWTANNVPFAFTPKALSKFDSFKVPSGLLRFAVQPSLPRSRATYLPEVSPEAVCQTQSGEGRIRNFPRRPRIRGLAWSALQGGPPVFRGRQREPFLRELDALTAPVRFDKRGCGTRGTVRIPRHRQPKGPDSASTSEREENHFDSRLMSKWGDFSATIPSTEFASPISCFGQSSCLEIVNRLSLLCQNK
jgi:hypothetical protein